MPSLLTVLDDDSDAKTLPDNVQGECYDYLQDGILAYALSVRDESCVRRCMQRGQRRTHRLEADCRILYLS